MSPGGRQPKRAPRSAELMPGAGTDAVARIDVVVITWNKYELSRDCLEHIFASTIPVNVIVVDNASEDETPRKVREQFPEVQLIENRQNLGFGPAANIGFAAGTAEFVSVVNSDANVEPNYFEEVIERFADASVGIAAGLSMNPATRKLDASGASVDRGLSWLPLNPGEDPEAVELSNTRVAAPCFDAVVFRREAIESVGGFDDEIFAYWEDVDITMRIRNHGWTVAVSPAARVWHVGSASLGKRTVRQLQLAAWGRGYIAGRYRIGLVWLLTEVVAGLIDSVRLRSKVPLARRIAGWRHGRELPAREFPQNLEYESWWRAMRVRYLASR